MTRPRLRATRRGLVLRFVTSEDGRAVVKLQRFAKGRFKAVRTFRREVAQGKGSVSLPGGRSGRALSPGRYRAIVTVRDAAGNASRPVRAMARIRRPG